jgi:sterol 3beta-glucosyltransferase
VQPFVALGLGLQRAGLAVTVATHPEYEELITGRGLGYRRTGLSFKEQVESPAGQKWLESSDTLTRYRRSFEMAFRPGARRWFEDTRTATLDADALLFHPFAGAAYHTAEKRRIPALCVSPFPMVDSGEIEPTFWPAAPPWRWLRRWLNAAPGKALWSVFRDLHDAERIRLGLRPWRGANPFAELMAKIPVVHLYSPSVVPAPRDWGPRTHVTGYCFLDRTDDWRPSPQLAAFLAGGPAPLYVGFGSVTGRSPGELSRLVINAVARTKQRTILAGGWSGFDRGAPVPDHVCLVDSAPHDWLFPQVSAVVHHGGAGTTAAGLRAARPTLVCAFVGDQMFWGTRVARTGAGPMPLRGRDLDAGALAEGISRTLGRAKYREGAERLARALAVEDGVAKAVEVVTGHRGRPSTTGAASAAG